MISRPSSRVNLLRPPEHVTDIVLGQFPAGVADARLPSVDALFVPRHGILPSEAGQNELEVVGREARPFV